MENTEEKKSETNVNAGIAPSPQVDPEEDVEVEKVDAEIEKDAENGQREMPRRQSAHGDYDSEPRGERYQSNEEKLRAFKKQSEERLLHIKRSREAKIGKKKTR